MIKSRENLLSIFALIYLLLASIYCQQGFAQTDDKVLYFDGKHDYIRISPNENINTVRAITIEILVKPVGFDLGTWNNTEGLVSKGSNTKFGDWAIWIHRNSDNKDGFASAFTKFKCEFQFGNISVSSNWHKINNWYHVACTYDGDTTKIYINNKLEGSYSDYSSPQIYNNLPIFINHHIWNRGYQSSQRMCGYIDNFLLWNRALSANEIKETVNHKINLKDKHLLIYYNFNNVFNGDGGINDLSSYGYDGTIYGNAKSVLFSSTNDSIDSVSNGSEGNLVFKIFLAVVILLVLMLFVKYMNRKRKRIKEEMDKKEKEDKEYQLKLIKENKQKEEEEKEHKKILIESKKKEEEDKKYNLIINCPLCLGNGECMVIETYSMDETKNYDFTIRQIYEKPNDWTLNIDIWEGSGLPEKLHYKKSKREICPGCKGKGIAYAYFENSHMVNCSECDGKGKVENRVKLDLGSKIELLNCKSCNGTGKKIIDFVHVQTLTKPALGEWHNENEKEKMMNKNWRFSITLTDENKSFYSKYKFRFNDKAINNTTEDFIDAGANYERAVEKFLQLFDQMNNEKKIQVLQETIDLCEHALEIGPTKDIEVRCHGLIGRAYSYKAIINNEVEDIAKIGINKIPDVFKAVTEKELSIKLDLEFGLKIYSDPKIHYDFFPFLNDFYSQETIFLARQNDNKEMLNFLKGKLLPISDGYGFYLPTLALYIGELYRRENNANEAEIWFGNCLRSLQLFLAISDFYNFEKDYYEKLKITAIESYERVAGKKYNPSMA